MALSVEPGAEELRRQAAANTYRGSSTFRLASHETIRTEGLPDAFAALMRKKYEQGEGPADAVLLRLSSAERSAYGLPEAPGWIGTYL